VTSVLVLADDLSGAAEASAAIAGGGLDILLWPHLPDQLTGAALCIDTDSRALTPRRARRRIDSILWRVPMYTLLYKKVDSLLRGNLAAELKAVSASGRGMVVALAVPEQSRSTRGGIVHVGETRLTESDVLGAAPATRDRVADALRGLDYRHVTIDQVRGSALVDALTTVLDQGALAICDATSAEDLDRIAAAVLELASHRPLAAVGAGGLARSLGRLRAFEREPDAPGGEVGDVSQESQSALCVVGSRSRNARLQVAALTASGARHLVITRSSARRKDEVARDILESLETATTVVTLSEDERWNSAHARRVAETIAAALDGTDAVPQLVLIGGATARQVLEALGIDRLSPRREFVGGAVLCRAPRGQSVILRPGSFGAELALVELVDALGGRTTNSGTRERP
jgi:uncharacterized protein YgbK (DUF1537 family)